MRVSIICSINSNNWFIWWYSHYLLGYVCPPCVHIDEAIYAVDLIYKILVSLYIYSSPSPLSSLSPSSLLLFSFSLSLSPLLPLLLSSPPSPSLSFLLLLSPPLSLPFRYYQVLWPLLSFGLSRHSPHLHSISSLSEHRPRGCR